tara:strand:- start:7659 stop:8330 length:672 start_codon:yes stop_codon:yes gene_type:complete
MGRAKSDLGIDQLGRPRKPLITRKTAIQAALTIIDAEGLDEFSLGHVARELGVKPPSLYYHFADRAELLAQVARQLLIESSFSDDSTESWEDRTVELCVQTRRSLLRHPNAAPLILRFFPRHVLLEEYEKAVRQYPDTREQHLAILEGIEKLTFGSALFQASAKVRNLEPMPEIDQMKYPNLAESIAANPYDDEAMFVQALRIFFSGVRVVAGREVTGREKIT